MFWMGLGLGIFIGGIGGAMVLLLSLPLGQLEYQSRRDAEGDL